jgi:Holliday junction resolvasome RuvABC endonuclease subunit
LDDDRIPLDASDALAAAICHLNARLYQIKVDDKEPS